MNQLLDCYAIHPGLWSFKSYNIGGKSLIRVLFQNTRQAGPVLCKAQLKLPYDFTLIATLGSNLKFNLN